MQCESIDLRQNPANTAVSSTHQDPERVKLLEQSQAEKENTFHVYNMKLIFCPFSLAPLFPVSPQVWSSVHQVEHLRRVQQLFEASQELDTLIVSTFRVDKHQQRTGTGWRTRCLPEPYKQKAKSAVSWVISVMSQDVTTAARMLLLHNNTA